MNCPKCNGKTYVDNSRRIDTEVIRVRVCKNCGYRFCTKEVMIDYNEGIEKINEYYRKWKEGSWDLN